MLNVKKFFNGLNIIPRSDGATAPNSQGDLAVSSADGKLYYNNGSVTVALVGESTSGTITNKMIIVSGSGANTFNDGTDNTKEILFDASTATTATILTLGDNQTTSQRLNFPNIAATDTLVANATAATLTNKTISGASNTLSNISLTTSVTGILPLANGGTGLNSASVAALFNSINPMSTTGDVIYEASANTAARLPIGTSGQVLTVTGGVPVWATPSPGFANPMTSVGDMIIGGSSGTPTRLAATSNGFILTLVTGSPAWVANSGGAAPTSIGALDGQSANAMGLTIASNVLYAQSATASFPGMVNTGTQTFGGQKTFATGITMGGALNMGTNLINNVVDPVSAQDAATRNYADTHIMNPIQLQQISTPSNPPSGSNDLYFKVGLTTNIAASNVTNSNFSSGSFTMIGQAFTTVGSTNANSCTFNLKLSAGSATGTLVAYIETDNSGVPSGTILATSSTINGSTLTTSFAPFVFSFGTPASLSASTKYHIVLDRTSLTLSGNSLQVAADNANPYAGGDAELFLGSWATQTGDDLQFSVDYIAPSNNLLYTLNSSGLEQIIGGQANGFQFFASSQVTTDSSAITGTSFVTFSTSPAFTFTPSVTGKYKIYSSATFEQTSGVPGIARIFNTSGSATLLNESMALIDSGSAILSSLYIQSVYTLTSGNPYVFDIQGKNAATGSFTMNGSQAPFYIFAELCG